MKAPKFILVHNHPTGDATPSQKDMKVTNHIYDVAKLVGIELLDHLVIGNKTYTSIFSKMLSNTKD